MRALGKQEKAAAFDQAFQAYAKAYPHTMRRRIAIYHFMAKKIINAIEQLPPDKKRRVQKAVYNDIVAPMGETLEPNELPEFRNRLFKAVSSLSKLFKIPIPARAVQYFHYADPKDQPHADERRKSS